LSIGKYVFAAKLLLKKQLFSLALFLVVRFPALSFRRIGSKEIQFGQIVVPRALVVFFLLLLAQQHKPEKEKAADDAKPRPCPRVQRAQRNDRGNEQRGDDGKDDS